MTHSPATTAAPSETSPHSTVAAAFLEPDPDVEWDEHRLARIQEVLRTWVPDGT